MICKSISWGPPFMILTLMCPNVDHMSIWFLSYVWLDLQKSKWVTQYFQLHWFYIDFFLLLFDFGYTKKKEIWWIYITKEITVVFPLLDFFFHFLFFFFNKNFAIYHYLSGSSSKQKNLTFPKHFNNTYISENVRR